MNRIFILNNPNSPRLNSSLAAEIGLNESILLLQLEFWISISENKVDGKLWTYRSTSEMIKTSFPFWSQSTINRTINSLKSKNLVIVSRYNKVKYDKTRWFSLNYDEIEKLNSVTVKSVSDIPKQPDADLPVQISYPEPPPEPPAVLQPEQPDEISFRDIIEGGVMSKIPCENKVSVDDRKWLTDQVMAFDEDFVRQQIDYTNKKISKKGKQEPKIYFAYLRTRINQENFDKYAGEAGLIEKPKAAAPVNHPPVYVPPKFSDDEEERKQRYFKLLRWFIELPNDRKESIVPGSSEKDRFKIYDEVNKHLEKVSSAYERMHA